MLIGRSKNSEVVVLMTDLCLELEDSKLLKLKSSLSFDIGVLGSREFGEWSDDQRGVPNSILRSALFGAIGRGKRVYHSGVIAALGDVFLKQIGVQFDQADLDVWGHSLHISRYSPLGESVEFSAYRFLKDIGRHTGKSQRDWLEESFVRLMTSEIQVSEGGKSYTGKLIQHHVRDKTGLHKIKINKELANLYGHDGYTKVDWNERLALRKHPLAQWLHGFYSTHARPFRYKLKTIHHLCGSHSKSLNDFKKDVIKAFEVMHSEIKWTGEISASGLITMTKPCSRSQRRHLHRKLDS